AALRSVTYFNNSHNPSSLPRTVVWQVNDGAAANNLSAPVTSTINVTPVNDPPTLTTSTITYSTVGNTQLHVAGATIPGVTAVTDSQNILTKSNPQDVDGPGPLDVVAASGSSAHGGSFSVNTDGSFTYIPAAGFTGTDTFSFTVQDHGSPNGTVVGTV